MWLRPASRKKQQCRKKQKVKSGIRYTGNMFFETRHAHHTKTPPVA
jgi:hypothetical protein